MADPRAYYTPEEDNLILSYVKEAEDEKISKKTAFLKLADKLGRNAPSIAAHYRVLLRKVDGQTNSKMKFMSEGERLALKLKGISHNQQRQEEKTMMYKERYHDLKQDYDKLLKQYTSLEADHARLLKTVKEVLGEE